jgi:hypothetical protein
VEAEAQALDGRVRIARGEEVARDAGFLDAIGRVDVEVEEAGKNERRPCKIVVALDRGDAPLGDDERPGKRADNWIDDKAL